MAEPVVKFPTEQKAQEKEPASSTQRKGWRQVLRERRRTLLLVVVPLIAVIGGVAFYLSGGRYATTDDAYVGAQKVLITPDISGKIDKVVVKEGQHVNVNDVLFEIDPVPFRFALQQAKATLEQAKTTYDNLKSNFQSYTQMLELAHQGVDLKQRDVDRKTTLVKSSAGSQLDLDTSTTNLVLARAQLAIRRTSCLAMPICHSIVSRLMRRQKPHLIRHSATSTTRFCARR
jgi:membrane fusion protein (multidrug efflux system)